MNQGNDMPLWLLEMINEDYTKEKSERESTEKAVADKKNVSVDLIREIFLSDLIIEYFLPDDISLFDERLSKNADSKDCQYNIYYSLCEVMKSVFNSTAILNTDLTLLKNSIQSSTSINREYLLNSRYFYEGSMKGIGIGRFTNKSSYLLDLSGQLSFDVRLILFMKSLVLDYMQRPINSDFGEILNNLSSLFARYAYTSLFCEANAFDVEKLSFNGYYYNINGTLLVLMTAISSGLSCDSEYYKEEVKPKFNPDKLDTLRNIERDNEGVLIYAEGEFEEYGMRWDTFDGETSFNSGTSKKIYSIRAYPLEKLSDVKRSGKSYCYFMDKSTLSMSFGVKELEKRWDFFCGDLFSKYSVFEIGWVR